MTRYAVVKDGRIEATAGTRELALDMVRVYQEQEKKAHQWMWAEFSIATITNEEFIPYER